MEIVEIQRDDDFFCAGMWSLPHTQFSWLMRACVDCLPSFPNRLQGKQLSSKCALRSRPETMGHRLIGCNMAVNEERMKFRLCVSSASYCEAVKCT